MTEQSPSYLQNACTTARGDRMVTASLVCEEGVAHLDAGSLLVTDGASGLQVSVAAGAGFVDGTQIANQGTYHVFNDAAKTLTASAADPTDDRIDLVVARVYDSEYSGALDEWRLELVTGAASPSPAPPALPANSLVLAELLINAGSSTIAPGDITDARVSAVLCQPYEITAFTDDAAINDQTPVDDIVGPGGSRVEAVEMVFVNASTTDVMLVAVDIQALIRVTTGVGDNDGFAVAVNRNPVPSGYVQWAVFAEHDRLPGGVWAREGNARTDHIEVAAGATVTIDYQVEFTNTGPTGVTLNKIGIRARGLLLTKHV